MYYSIGEVAHIFNVAESLLRHWEREFPQIAPEKGGRGIRRYREEDIETIRLIHHLVKEKGMTLSGAKKRLQQNRQKTADQLEVITRLKEIKAELLAIKDELDAVSNNPLE